MSWFVGVPVALGLGADGLIPVDADLAVLGAADRHVTLVFLGQAPEADARAVWAAVPGLVLPSTTRALAWERFGRTAIALSLSDDGGRLEAGAMACHDAADGLVEVRRPSPFRPHVTMGRVRRRARPPDPRALRGWPVPSDPLELGLLTLYRSRTDRSADRYEIVDRRREPH